MATIGYLVGYTSFDKKFGPEFVCEAKNNCKFRTYRNAVEYIKEQKLAERAPYKCRAPGPVHFHLTKEPRSIEYYKRWQVKENKRKENRRIKSDLRGLESNLNFGVDHQTVMDEIELGI